MAELNRRDVIGILAGDAPSLAGVDLSGLDLSGLDFSRVSLAGANLSKSDLRGAIFGSPNEIEPKRVGRPASFVLDRRLSGADFTGADLSDARWSDGTPADGLRSRLKKADGAVFTDSITRREQAKAERAQRRELIEQSEAQAIADAQARRKQPAVAKRLAGVVTF
jgi:uncharacterized protein YjbI with pentapeptide repeats